MGRTPLHYAMGTSNPQTFAKIILSHGGNVLLRDVVSFRSPKFECCSSSSSRCQ